MTLALVDERIDDGVSSALSERGFSVIKLPRCTRLPEAIAAHPDSLVARVGDTLLVEGEYLSHNRDLFELVRAHAPYMNIKEVTRPLGSRYPDDCALNALMLGGRLYARRESLADEILCEAVTHGLDVVSVKQGYPACATLALGDRAAITADRGLARVFCERGIDVLTVDDGGIKLPPYEYGFIGGASGVYRDTVYFLGDVSSHPSAEAICEFCMAKGFRVVSLSGAALSDLGGILFIDSEKHDAKG